MMHHTHTPQRFYSLDVLRGVASLSVVLWHWQVFFLPFNKLGVESSIDKQPLFDVLSFFYKNGVVAVQLFFCLSGFIFFWLYSIRIANKTISLGSFSVLRLSRLYPLHFITLIFVAAGQIVYTGITNMSFVYPFNDTYHFLLNLFFVSSWGLEKGLSFNGPIWSVSIEVLLYAMFFVFCRIFRQNLTVLILIALIGYFVQRYNHAIGSGVMCFFLGGIAFIAYEKILKGGDTWKVSIWLPLITSIAWLVTISVTSSNHVLTIFIEEAPWILQKIISNFVVVALFPMTVMSLALIETKKGTLGKRWAFVGDISYSSYLLHFPLQLATVLVTAKLAISQELFYSPWFMALFFMVLIMISLASHRYFEVPMQHYLRLRLATSGGSG